MSLVATLTTTLELWAKHVPIELFTVVGAFLEEVIAPIPSPFVMTIAGSIAGAQESSLLFLLWIAILGAIGKTVGSYILYFITDKAEDVILGRFGEFFGVSHKELEAIGKHLNGGWRDDFILLLLRSIPLMPSAPIAVACGAIKISPVTFLWTTFVGSILRNLVFLYLGWAGAEGFLHGISGAESLIQIMVLGVFAVVLIWLLWQRKQGKHWQLLRRK